MVLDLPLRDIKEAVLQPVCRPFKSIHPNYITVVAFFLGLICAYLAAQGSYGWALLFWGLNRTADGLDGVVARAFNKQSDFGGYLDIVLDFVVYGVIPPALVSANPSNQSWLIVSLLEAVYFVNAAALFQLSAILEKRQAGAKSKKELTTVTMPPALIEGTETVVFYSLFLLFPTYNDLIFSLFGGLVAITIVQRVWWASKIL
eukprot:TRINITY_DN3962_c0_g1_i1.p1 TRINITY_DN3962_c0_g1~~TRINITY_DN3962_c0_g1_i1.p1  ORF type:complete len:203 (+),score=41.17 TRINITY_DN3962_c0_g1_i1:16-624(+)